MLVTITVQVPQLDQIVAAIAGVQASIDSFRKEMQMESAATEQALKSAVDALVSEEASEVARYEALLTALRANPTDPAVEAAITQIQGVVADLKGRAVSGTPSPSPAPIP